MGWWISRAPELEEDVALANIGLDQLGQARTLLSYAGELEGEGRTEDDLAYLRDDREFRNVKLVERPMTDFGVAMARLLLFSTYQLHLYRALATCSDATLSRGRGEGGQGGRLPRRPRHPLGAAPRRRHRRVTRAHAGRARRRVAVRRGALRAGRRIPAGRVADPAAIRDAVLSDVRRVVAEATLDLPEVPPALGGGRQGLHTEHLGFLLAEMQHLHRSHPGATW